MTAVSVRSAGLRMRSNGSDTSATSLSPPTKSTLPDSCRAPKSSARPPRPCHRKPFLFASGADVAIHGTATGPRVARKRFQAFRYSGDFRHHRVRSRRILFPRCRRSGGERRHASAVYIRTHIRHRPCGRMCPDRPLFGATGNIGPDRRRISGGRSAAATATVRLLELQEGFERIGGNVWIEFRKAVLARRSPP